MRNYNCSKTEVVVYDVPGSKYGSLTPYQELRTCCGSTLHEINALAERAASFMPRPGFEVERKIGSGCAHGVFGEAVRK